MYKKKKERNNILINSYIFNRFSITEASVNIK